MIPRFMVQLIEETSCSHSFPRYILSIPPVLPSLRSLLPDLAFSTPLQLTSNPLTPRFSWYQNSSGFLQNFFLVAERFLVSADPAASSTPPSRHSVLPASPFIAQGVSRYPPPAAGAASRPDTLVEPLPPPPAILVPLRAARSFRSKRGSYREVPLPVRPVPSFEASPGLSVLPRPQPRAERPPDREANSPTASVALPRVNSIRRIGFFATCFSLRRLTRDSTETSLFVLRGEGFTSVPDCSSCALREAVATYRARSDVLCILIRNALVHVVIFYTGRFGPVGQLVACG